MKATLWAKLAAAASLAALLAGLAGKAAAFGLAAVALIVLLAGLGLRAPGAPSRATLAILLAFGVLFGGLLVLAFLLHDPDSPLALIGGFPAGTAMLVYGIGPLGLALGVLYGLAFDREILREGNQRRFLERHGRTQARKP